MKIETTICNRCGKEPALRVHLFEKYVPDAAGGPSERQYAKPDLCHKCACAALDLLCGGLDAARYYVLDANAIANAEVAKKWMDATTTRGLSGK